MDFSLTESERELVGLCRDFAQKEIAPRAPLAWEEARCPTDLLREMGALGLLGMLIPEEWGGIGMSTVGFVAAMEQIGLADQSVAAAWQAHVTIGSLAAVPVRQRRPAGAMASTAGRGPGPRRLRAHRTRRRFRRPWDPHPGRAARRRVADQRPQDVHLQRRHRHVLRGDPAGPHRAGSRAGGRGSPAWWWRRTRPASPWAPRCAASAGGASTPASSTSTTSGCPTTTSSATRTWGSASSWPPSRSGASLSRRCRSA